MEPNRFTVVDRTIRAGDFYAPGFYMDYWDNVIVTNIPSNIVLSNSRLKPYRELWIGAILAAAQTKATGNKYYVGIPDSDPPDVIIGTLTPVQHSSGRTGNNFDYANIEIVRCDISVGEDLLTQVLLKNTAAYQDMIVAVYVFGGTADLTSVSEILQQEPTVYPVQITVVAEAVATSSGLRLAQHTYLVETVFPLVGQDLVNRHDSNHFFNSPSIITRTGRGLSPAPIELGQVRLLPPNLND